VAFTAPVPRSPRALSSDETTAGRRSHVILGLGRSFAVHPTEADRPRDVSLDVIRSAFTPSPRLARPLFTRTATLFGALHASVFKTDRRLSTSATACATYGQPDPDSRFPHGDEGRDLPPFLTHHAQPLLAKGGDTRWAVHVRPFASTPVPVPPACAGLPDRDTDSTAPPLGSFGDRELSDD